MKKPIIGIPANLLTTIMPASVAVDRNYVNMTYTNAIKSNGGVPLVIPFIDNPEGIDELLDLCDGFLIPGGEDIDPILYHEGPHQMIGEIRPDHDRFLLHILQYAADHHKACLGVCKGMQLIAVFGGGTLYQDIASQRNEASFAHSQKGGRDHLQHLVNLKQGSLIHSIINMDTVAVNSMHHQSVKSIGDDFWITAYADDGVVEAIESKDSLFLGVQWHPEELFAKHAEMSAIFKNLIERSCV